MREPSAIEAPASAAPPASVAASVVGTGAAAVGEGETNKVAVLVVVVVLLIAGIVAGLVIYGALGSQETDDRDDKTKAPSKGNDARTSKMPPGTKSTRKAGLFVCVVGLHLSSRDPLETGFCDYIIYPELTLLHNKVVSTYGGTSWNIFKAAIKGFRSGTKAGGSFLESHPENYLSEELTAVENVVEPPLKFRALGFLDIKFAANALDPLKERLQVFNRILKTKPDGMTFLGVVVPSYSLGRVLAKELKDITYVNTIILQTHITPSTEDITHGACTVNYVAYRLGKKASAVPSFSIANKTWIEIKKQGHKFRVMFSLTFGVMIYTSTDEIKEYNDLCEDAFLGTVDALCPETGQNIVLKDDKEELAKYATWESNRTHHFLTTMDGNDIKAVLAEFIEDVSNGWAGFNIELDERKACNVDKKFALLKMIATAARTRKKP